MKVRIYKSGERFVMDGMTVALHKGELQEEVDLPMVTEKEKTMVFKNPHDDKLLQNIKTRKKQ